MRYLAAIVESSDAAIIGKAFDGVIISWNKGAERIYGYTEKEVFGKHVSLLVPEDRVDELPAILARIELGQKVESYETVRRAKDGTLIDVSLTVSPVYNQEGSLVGSSTIARDITRLKRAEEALNQATAAAEAASRAKSEFLANMSHEIRTPLNGILGMLQLLATTTLDQEQSDFLSIAVKSSTRLSDLLADILDLSRIEADRLPINEAAFEVRELKDSVMETFLVAAEMQGVTLDCSLDARMPARLVSDVVRVRQILFNLVGNAIKFTEKGSVHVDIKPLPERGGQVLSVLFTVSDTGIGLADVQLENIFEPFVQVEGSFTRRYDGAGLGLSIVRKLTRLLNGSLSIDSAEGEGTTVYLSLPFKLPGTQRPAVKAPPQARHLPDNGPDNGPDAGPSAGLPRILLAEDEAVNRLSFQRLLEKAGYPVSVAVNGQEALGLLNDQDFDVILMDIQMPVMDGVAATRAIRSSISLGAKARVPIIAMTAHTMSGDQEKFLTAGMNGYIAKPLDMADLRELIGRVLSWRA